MNNWEDKNSGRDKAGSTQQAIAEKALRDARHALARLSEGLDTVDVLANTIGKLERAMYVLVGSGVLLVVFSLVVVVFNTSPGEGGDGKSAKDVKEAADQTGAVSHDEDIISGDYEDEVFAVREEEVDSPAAGSEEGVDAIGEGSEGEEGGEAAGEGSEGEEGERESGETSDQSTDGNSTGAATPEAKGGHDDLNEAAASVKKKNGEINTKDSTDPEEDQERAFHELILEWWNEQDSKEAPDRKPILEFLRDKKYLMRHDECHGKEVEIGTARHKVYACYEDVKIVCALDSVIWAGKSAFPVACHWIGMNFRPRNDTLPSVSRNHDLEDSDNGRVAEHGSCTGDKCADAILKKVDKEGLNNGWNRAHHKMKQAREGTGTRMAAIELLCLHMKYIDSETFADDFANEDCKPKE